MRCPKCQYISFDNGDRCRNCGYEFSLSPAEAPVDVTIARDEPAAGRMTFDSLTAPDAPLSSGHPPVDPELPNAAGVRRPLTPEDLPLFTDRIADDQAPLVTPPAVPRAPLSVRRANPGVRPRLRPAEPEELPLGPPTHRDPGGPEDVPEDEAHTGRPGGVAGIPRRLGAGLIDLLVLGAIDAAVFYLTLRLCGLTVDEWHVLPLPPMLAFLLLLSGGYFVLFTAAGGQTIGKMLTRIRVVSTAGEETGPKVSFSAAFVRAVASAGSLLPLGAGFLPVLFSADRRAFHDRVADTRVVAA